MKVLLVVDTPQWAFGSIAENLRRRITGIEVSIIYTAEYTRYEDFLSDLTKPANQSDVIHFFWRDYLRELLLYVENVKPQYQKIFVQRTITTHVPDHLFIDDNKELETRLPMLKFVDSYFVTSQKLYDAYARLVHVDKPHSIIHDNPLLKVYPSDKHDDGQVEIVWIGNSKWGEYLGYTDYKGLERVVKPAIKRLKKDRPGICYHEFDKARRHTERGKVLRTLARADILLISSVDEGTPLPLIEAMAHRCAIITSDVGIAREVLPEIQQEFIVERHESAVYDALDKLCSNRELLEDIKNQNLASYDGYFKQSDIIAERWKAFFEDAVSKDRAAIKADYLTLNKKSFVTKAAAYALGRTLSVSKKTGLADAAKSQGWIRSGYSSVISAINKNSVNYDLFASSYEQNIVGRKVIALYSPYWPGVANSTASFFKQSALAYPLFSYEYPNVKDHVFLDRIVDMLAESGDLECVIVSGGTVLQMELVKKLKKLRPEMQTFFGWHGSPAQWVDISQYYTFLEWKKLHSEGLIDGFISFKPELDQTLEALGITAYSVKNYVVETPYNNVLGTPTEESFKVGLFAAMFSWYKNPFPQVMALAHIEGCELTTNLRMEKDFSWIADYIDIKRVPEALSNRAFMNLLAGLHVVLYVTNTECSPMIALESVAVLTPCIVGPAGNIYKGHSELEKYLVVTEIDNPTAITAKLEQVRANHSEIRKLLIEFKVAYNRDLDVLRDSLINELTQ